MTKSVSFILIRDRKKIDAINIWNTHFSTIYIFLLKEIILLFSNETFFSSKFLGSRFSCKSDSDRGTVRKLSSRCTAMANENRRSGTTGPACGCGIPRGWKIVAPHDTMNTDEPIATVWRRRHACDVFIISRALGRMHDVWCINVRVLYREAARLIAAISQSTRASRVPRARGRVNVREEKRKKE